MRLMPLTDYNNTQLFIPDAMVLYSDLGIKQYRNQLKPSCILNNKGILCFSQKINNINLFSLFFSKLPQTTLTNNSIIVFVSLS
jgi:hypothetical protein